jgi:hypothetical protein
VNFWKNLLLKVMQRVWKSESLDLVIDPGKFNIEAIRLVLNFMDRGKMLSVMALGPTFWGPH